ncbi:hypothetical protein [Gulosibacter chungangensis]|uniref:Uncharacterized protein n=1 Tax=Gulosibacter chungangensis TaxID=979746 RepID=A0A7J5BEY8_9MICO|nr:hypothetical protein [Gulosibacter chungangensis]KAB1643913.1 hypothetical protein F8O05_03685 [Gulosibacter chungangensis]
MIRFDEIPNLEGEQAERVRALIDRGSEIWDMPEDLSQVEAWERQAADCEAEGLPHYVASARFGQYTVYSQGGLIGEALGAYARLMQVIARYGDYIAPENVARFLGSVSSIAVNMISDPSIPRDQIQQVIGLVEEQLRARGMDMSNVYLARAEIATEFGDAAAMHEWRHRWQAEGSEEWPQFDPDTVSREIAIIQPLNPNEAISVLEQRFGAMGVQPGLLDPQHPEFHMFAMLRARLGALYTRIGRRDIAAIIGDELRQQFSAEWLARNVIIEEALAVLEHRPEDALEITDYALGETELGATDWQLIAAVARNRILADPQGEEGRLLQQLAEDNARAHDERSGTDWHARELEEYWFAGLPEGPRPAIVDDPSIWNDVPTRAEHILLAGWLPRRGSQIALVEAPIAMRDRYVELSQRPFEILDAETAEEADTQLENIREDAERFRLPDPYFAALVMRVGRAAKDGDAASLIGRYAQSQQVLRDHKDVIQPGLRAAAEQAFAVVIKAAIAEPRIPLEKIREVIDTEAAVREITGAPRAPLLQAEAEVAAHFGDGAALQHLVGEIARVSEAEQDALDRFEICLETVRVIWPYAPDYAESLVEWVRSTTSDEAHRRAATAWAGWFARRRGGDSGVDTVLQMLESVDRDADEFGSVPEAILLELGTERPDELPWLIDSVVENLVPGAGYDLENIASLATILLEHAPEDPRGPQLREDALRIVAELDARNGNTFHSDMLRQRWSGLLTV